MERTASRAWTLIVLAVAGALPPYLGPVLGFELNTRDIVEVVDHVLPAVAVGAVGIAALVRDRIGLVGGVVSFLGGLWMAGTHVPLLLQIPSGRVTPGTAAFHSTPGFVLLAVGALALFVWTAQEERHPAVDVPEHPSPAGNEPGRPRDGA